jgi:hypothetical protein
MEDTNQPLDSGAQAGSPGRLHFSDPVRGDLVEIAKWAMFFSVLLFIVLGLISLLALFMIFAAGGVGLIGAIFMVGIYGVILYFPAWYYYKFSVLSRQAIANGDNAALDDSFMYLRLFYRFVGILVIILLSLYALILVVGISMMGNLGGGGFPD